MHLNDSVCKVSSHRHRNLFSKMKMNTSEVKKDLILECFGNDLDVVAASESRLLWLIKNKVFFHMVSTKIWLACRTRALAWSFDRIRGTCLYRTTSHLL